MLKYHIFAIAQVDVDGELRELVDKFHFSVSQINSTESVEQKKDVNEVSGECLKLSASLI